MSHAPQPSAEDFVRAQSDPPFVQLRTKHRRFVFPMTVFFLAWYLLYVLVAAFAPQFMGIRVYGYINIGIIWGLLQFVSTFAITAMYVHFANRTLDPAATAIREQLEADAARVAAFEDEIEEGRP